MHNNIRKLLILGAGGHGKVVADAASAMQYWEEIAFLDDDEKKGNLPYKVLGSMRQLPEFIKSFSTVIVALGNNHKREELLKKSAELGFILATIIHPRAYVSKYAAVEPGTVVFAHAVINPYAKVGFGSIINSAAVIEHDCVLDTAVHISPNAALAGAVTVGKYSWIGIGSNIIEKITIGDNVIVGAGSVVIENIPNNSIVVGVPAKVIKTNEN